MSLGELLAIILGAGSTTAMVTCVTQIILWKMNRRAAKEDRNDNGFKRLERALRAILHDRIKWLGKKYIDDGSVSSEDFSDLMEMHECYHDDLGGDGLLDNIMKRVHELRVRR